LRYLSGSLPDRQNKAALKNLSLIYFTPFICAFLFIFIFPIPDFIPVKVAGIINVFLIILFNLGIIFWSRKYSRTFAANYEKEKLNAPNDVKKFQSEFGISKRELEVVELICKGKTNKEIAEALFISIQTVKDHNYNIFRKTGVKNRTQLSHLFMIK